MWLKVIKNGMRADGTMGWSLVAVEWKDGKEFQKRVPRDQYLNMGFPLTLTFDEAREKVRSLAAKEKLEKSTQKRFKITQRLENERLANLAFLPRAVIEEFEEKILAPKYTSSSELDPKSTIAKKWRATLRTMVKTQLDPSDWYERPFLIYNVLIAERYSPDYCDRIIGLMNEYGYFYCRKFSKAFLPVHKLTKRNRVKQADANRQKGQSKKSDPITPEALESQKSNLKPMQYNWLFITVWFGLRADEMAVIGDDKAGTKFYTSISKGVTILHVYQPKLVLVPFDERWKMIPILYPEQKIALKLLEKGKFSRPLNSTLKKYFTPRTTCRGGRKGFTDLMLGKGQDFVDISQWLGHKSLDRTWGDYKNRKIVHFKKPE
jgi:integrase